MRWNSEELGRVNPEEFIAVAEGNGFINELGLWVLSTAMELVHTRPDLMISINASAMQFNNDQLYHAIKQLHDGGELVNNNLCIEITEGILLEETPSIQQMLSDIRGFNVGMSIDDFGTGYSSLSYLKRCPVNKLKIRQIIYIWNTG